MTHHEFRDADGNLIAVLDLVEPKAPIAGVGMVELAADVGGRSVRVRVFPPKVSELPRRVAA
jgi:hypothetical protein